MAAASCILPKASGAQQAAEDPAKSPMSDGISIFEDVWQTVRDRFYDPHFNGLDWSAVSERYRAAAAQAISDERLAVVINNMLSELHASHTRYSACRNLCRSVATARAGSRFPGRPDILSRHRHPLAARHIRRQHDHWRYRRHAR